MNQISVHLLGNCSYKHQQERDFFYTPMQFYDSYWTENLKCQIAYHPSNVLFLQYQCPHQLGVEDQTSVSSLWWAWSPESPRP
uniref:Uncharacterized protein LOC105121218 n=1 Tax=Rhizophora mucronata TaxID=61149 RepID=A0A2P2MGX6_RHIMU